MKPTGSLKNRWERKIALALIVASLMLTSNGCSTAPTVTKTELQRVPAALLSPCGKSELEEQTYEGGLKLAENRGRDLDECNARLEDIRKWSAQP
jgi:hypothetical protein